MGSLKAQGGTPFGAPGSKPGGAIPSPVPPPSTTSSGEGVPQLHAFGKYLLLERVAIGGMAEVWLGKRMQETEGEPDVSDLLAIKRILPNLVEDDEFIRMFVDEARIAGQLEHPGIASIHELGRIGSSFYIAMEYVWGRDLLQVLRRIKERGERVPAKVVAYVGARMCEALHYAHTKTDKTGQPLGLVHRDISPQNVLLSFDGKVKLIDFGIAKAASRSTKTQAGTLKGKVGYMSPEQVSGTLVDHRSDQFAVGTCLYEMLQGKPLFARGNNFDALNRVRDADVPPLLERVSDCPPELAAIVMRALSKERDARFPSALEMQRELMVFLAKADPNYDRLSLTAWVRELFGAELPKEKLRLDSLDLIGRPAVKPVKKKHRNSVTNLEIGSTDLYEDDEDAETQIFEGSPFEHVDVERPQGPYEVFFNRGDLVQLGAAQGVERPLRATFRPGRAGAIDTWRQPRMEMEEGAREVGSRDTDPTPSPTVEVSPELAAFLTPAIGMDRPRIQPPERERADPSDPGERIASVESSDDLAIDPQQLNSQIIRQILPKKDPSEPTAGEKPRRTDEPTAHVPREASGPQRSERDRETGRQRAARVEPRPRSVADIVFLVLLGTFLLALGAGGTWLAMSSGASSTLEVHTTPPVPAMVLVDGAPRGRAPLRIEGLPPGRHTVSLVADGVPAVNREIVVGAREVRVLDVEIVPVGAVTAPP